VRVYVAPRHDTIRDVSCSTRGARYARAALRAFAHARSALPCARYATLLRIRYARLYAPHYYFFAAMPRCLPGRARVTCVRCHVPRMQGFRGVAASAAQRRDARHMLRECASRMSSMPAARRCRCLRADDIRLSRHKMPRVCRALRAGTRRYASALRCERCRYVYALPPCARRCSLYAAPRQFVAAALSARGVRQPYSVIEKRTRQLCAAQREQCRARRFTSGALRCKSAMPCAQHDAIDMMRGRHGGARYRRFSACAHTCAARCQRQKYAARRGCYAARMRAAAMPPIECCRYAARTIERACYAMALRVVLPALPMIRYARLTSRFAAVI